MNNLFKTILIISLAVFGAGVILVLPTNAQVDELVVEYWTGEKWEPLQGPIFSETDFKPGDQVTRRIRVTNNSGRLQRIATEAINYPGFPDPDKVPEYDLSRALTIIIREGTKDLYGGASPTGPKTLYNFYQDSATYPEIALSDLANGTTTQYDFTISFPAEKGNEWQGATTTFDILIGFQGKEGGEPSPGGLRLPPGLTILSESVTTTAVSATSATIAWTTSYPASSQVIYAAEGEAHTLDLGATNYGYAHSKEGDDSKLERVIHHSVTITGLSASTTYYYRCVSHASLAISREHSFTTLGVKEEERVEERRIPPEEILPPEGRVLGREIVSVPPKEEIGPPEEEVVVPPEKKAVTLPPEEKIPKEDLASLLLASLGMIKGSPWKMALIIFCLVGLALIGIREWELIRRKKKQI